MSKFDYKDPEIYGMFDDIIVKESRPYYAYINNKPYMLPDGTRKYVKNKFLVYGSLQTWKSSRTYDADGIRSSIRVGKFYTVNNYNLKANDVIQKNNEFFTIKQVADYDNAGVRTYEVERIGLDEIVKYDFESYLETRFEDMEQAT